LAKPRTAVDASAAGGVSLKDFHSRALDLGGVGLDVLKTALVGQA
jgi:hypothetical protein